MKNGIHITDHGEKRIRKRLGLSKQSVEKNAQEAFLNGIRHDETTGQLRQYINKLFLSGESKGTCPGNIRIFNHYVYIFAGNTLVTVLKLPKNLEGAENSIMQKRIAADTNNSIMQKRIAADTNVSRVGGNYLK